MKIIDVQTMRELDRATIYAGTPGEILMERAGRGAFDEFLPFAEALPERHARRVAVLAGKGNNGGDGYVLARLLAEETHLPTTVYSICSRKELDGDTALNADRLPSTVLVKHCPEELPAEALAPGTILVDALLGTGISGPLKPPFDTVIEQINASGLPVFAIDIPSGVDGNSGAIATNAVVADMTVTMAHPKTGMFTPVGRARCGKLRLVDIGIDKERSRQAKSHGEALFAEDIRPLLQRRPFDSHKNTFGHTLVLGGAAHYVGAPQLAASAALKTGAGLVSLAAPLSVMLRMNPTFDAIITIPVPETEAGPTLTRDGLEKVPELHDRSSALVLGPGIGRAEPVVDVIEDALSWQRPTVIDADALILIASHPRRFPSLTGTILTPHPGEMKSLMNGFGLDPELVTHDRAQAAVQLAKTTGAIVVLKGMTTVVATPGGDAWLNSSGTAALATAGTGDVLAGMIGAFLAQGLDRVEAAQAGVFIHGLAAELANMPERCLVADNLIDLIPQAMHQVSPLA